MHHVIIYLQNPPKMFRCWRCWARVKLFSTKADADWDKPSWQVWDDPYALRSVSMKYLHFSLSSVGQLSTMDIIKPPVARETCVFWLVGSGCWRRLKTSERLLWLDYHLNCHKAVQKTKKQAKRPTVHDSCYDSVTPVVKADRLWDLD